MNVQLSERKVCALTGHRKLPADFDKNALIDCLEERILSGTDYFLCGMAQGFDLLALECLLYLRKKYKFEIEACVPYVGQELSFEAAERKRYKEFLELCDKKIVIFDSYRQGCFLARDRYMVNCADELVAYCKRETGGTAYTVREAKKQKIPVYFVE